MTEGSAPMVERQAGGTWKLMVEEDLSVHAGMLICRTQIHITKEVITFREMKAIVFLDYV